MPSSQDRYVSANLGSRAQEGDLERRLGPQADAERALGQADGLLARLAPVMVRLRDCKLPRAGPGDSPSASDKAASLIGAFERTGALLASQRQALSGALQECSPIVRQQRLARIPLALVQASCKQLLAAVEVGRHDPVLSSLIVMSPPVPASLASPRSEPRMAGSPDSPRHAAVAAGQVRREIGQARAVIKFVAGRMAIVDKAVASHVRNDPSAIPAYLNPKVKATASYLARSYQDRPAALRASQVAAHQVIELRRELMACQQRFELLALQPPDEQSTQIGDFDLRSIKARLIPVRNLPRTFSGEPILDRLFAEPARGGQERRIPGA